MKQSVAFSLGSGTPEHLALAAQAVLSAESALRASREKLVHDCKAALTSPRVLLSAVAAGFTFGQWQQRPVAQTPPQDPAAQKQQQAGSSAVLVRWVKLAALLLRLFP